MSTRGQDTDRQEPTSSRSGCAGMSLYVDYGISGTRASRPEFDCVLAALHKGDTLGPQPWTGLAGRRS